MNESTDELRALYLGLDAEYRAAGEQLKALMAAPGARGDADLKAVLGRLTELQEQLDDVRLKLRDRLAQEGR